MAHDVFICYASTDKPTADAVWRALEAVGIPCWIASSDVDAEQELEQTIVEAIRGAKLLLLVFSAAANTRPQVERVIDHAVSDGLAILPLRIEDVLPSAALEYYLAGQHWFDATTPPLEAHLERLVAAVRTLLPPTADTNKLRDGRAGAEPAHAQGQRQPPSVGYDVFISYRRDRDAQTARLIRAELRDRGRTVFLDVDDLRPGHFDEALLEHIQDTPNFVLILSSGSLERCSEPDDWLRREIVCALENRKTIIPIMMPGFAFPAEHDLPEELHPIRVHHGVTYSHEYFGATMDKVVGFLGTAPAN